MIVCVDTNVILGMFGRSAPWLPLRQALLAGRFQWAISTEILMEYEEVTAREMSRAAADMMLRFIEITGRLRNNIIRVHPAFRFGLIVPDADDDKFADCAIAAHAAYIITEDRHFRVMLGSGYKPQPITPAAFIQRFLSGTHEEHSGQ